MSGTITHELGDWVVVSPFGQRGTLPVFVQPVDERLANDLDAAGEWIAERRQALDALLYEHGAFVLRGFPITGTAAFKSILRYYDFADFDYTGGASPREAVDDQIFEATNAPAEVVLGVHQEMSYLPNYPHRLAFFCHMPAVSGGETLIADMRAFTAGLSDEFRIALEARGVTYHRNFRDPGYSTGHPLLDRFHKTWSNTFATTDRDEATAKVKAMGMVPTWDVHGSLSVTYTTRGLAEHPVTGETLSFNQITTQSLGRKTMGDFFDLYEQHYQDGLPLPNHTTFGDGSPISEEQLAELLVLADTLVVAFSWSAGDILMLDNFRVGHGRNSYTGRRNVQVALLQ